jgi:hypothetical protein
MNKNLLPDPNRFFSMASNLKKQDPSLHNNHSTAIETGEMRPERPISHGRIIANHPKVASGGGYSPYFQLFLGGIKPHSVIIRIRLKLIPLTLTRQ